jgi:hypothetical protein
VLAQSNWEPTEALSYHSFGPATAEQDAFFGGLTPGSEGGRLIFKVALSVVACTPTTASSRSSSSWECLASTRSSRPLVLVQDTINNFNEPVSGDLIFIRS